MISLRYRRLLLPLFSLLAVTCCSCMETPQERLIGRWFNSQNSIRFKEDGTLVWNARTRRAYGRYWYTGESRASSSNQAQPNLTVQLVTANEQIVSKYELQYLGDDKLRLQAINQNGGAANRLFVLTKAGPDDTLTSELAAR
jgi:hypothetical protein